MLPQDLQPESFRSYSPKARQFCVANIDVLHQLPLTFVVFFLKEAIGFDWRFPAERKYLERQVSTLRTLPEKDRIDLFATFTDLRLSDSLKNSDWIDRPQQFSEKLSAELWSTHQIDEFRKAATTVVQRLDRSATIPPLPVNRLGIVLIGQQVADNRYALFRKLRRRGTYFDNVDPASAWPAIASLLTQRTAKAPEPYAHWYVDGGEATDIASSALTCVSYRSLDKTRNALSAVMTNAMQTEGGGPELLRTRLAQMRPADVGMDARQDELLNRFQLSLLTEGSGTQLFSTSFVQWTAREALRRAQPLTLLARFAPRRADQGFDMRPGSNRTEALDPQASLIDADMGAYYTYLNQQRLTGADGSGFVVWFEGQREAVAVGPAMPSDAKQSRPTRFEAILQKVSS